MSRYNVEDTNDASIALARSVRLASNLESYHLMA